MSKSQLFEEFREQLTPNEQKEWDEKMSRKPRIRRLRIPRPSHRAPRFGDPVYYEPKSNK